MSWSFKFIGTKKGVQREVAEAKGYDDDSQLKAAKTFIMLEIDAYPDDVKGVSVEAYGHHDSRSRNVFIKIDPIYGLAID